MNIIKYDFQFLFVNNADCLLVMIELNILLTGKC